MTTVFVSYARPDRARVERIVATLEKLGFPVFWDREIPPGSTWDQVLEHQLASVQCVLVVWSLQSVESDWVKTEAAEAKRLGKFVPVLIDDVPPPLEFRRIQTANLANWTGSEDDPEFRSVVEAISGLDVPAAPAGEGDVVEAGQDGAVEEGRGGAATVPRPSARPVVSHARGAPPLRTPGRPGVRTRWLATAAVTLAIGGIAAWLALRSRPSPGVRLTDANGACPTELEGTRLTARIGAEAMSGTIDEDCRFALPSSVTRERLEQLELVADSGSGFVFDTHAYVVPPDFPRSIFQVLAVAAASPRVEIAVLPYSGLNTEPRRAAFNEFLGILNDKLTNLTQELAATPELAGEDAARQIARLKFDTLPAKPDERSTGPSRAIGEGDLSGLDLEQKLRIWRQRHSLGLLGGTLSEEPTDQRRFQVNSQIFIGDLDGTPLGRSIPLAMAIGPEEFRNTRDAHALALLYALALDARRLGYSPDVVTAYLSKAYSIAQTLRESSPGGLPDAVARIAAQVNSELSQLSGRSRRP